MAKTLRVVYCKDCSGSSQGCLAVTDQPTKCAGFVNHTRPYNRGKWRKGDQPWDIVLGA